MKRIRVLQNISPQYFCDNGDLINGVLQNENPLPKISKKKPEFEKPKLLDKCSSMSSSILDNVPYGECGRFERRMRRILDNIEFARAEITGVQAIKLSNGQIQFVNDSQIKQRKCKEDLQMVSSCLEQILNEIKAYGTFDVLVKYVNEQNESIEQMKLLSRSDKESEKLIIAMNIEIENSKEDFKEKKIELLKLIQHLKHQKQELTQKNTMQNKFIRAKTVSDVQQLKLQLAFIVNEITNEIQQISNKTDTEEQVNTELSMYLRNSIQNMEQNVEYWTNTTAVETNKFQLKLKTLTKEHQNLTHELESLVGKYLLYEKVCIEDRQMKAEKAKLDAIDAFYAEKSFMIQKWWRFICVILSIGPHSTKKKSKKGKNKKKKKK